MSNNLLGTLSTLITPDMVSGLGKQLGLSDELIRQGLSVSSAVLVGGMARNAATPDGAAAVADMVNKADSGILGSLASVASSALGGSSTAEDLFGSNLTLVTDGVKKATGIDITPMLGLAAPVVLGITKNLAAQQGLDANGIAKLMQGEMRSLSRRDAATGKVIKEVFKPLDAQDKLRGAFSDEEWTTLQHGPVHTAALIIFADPSGRGGRRQEVEAMQEALDEAVGKAGPTELVNLLFRDGSSDDEIESLLKAYKRADGDERQQALLGPIGQAVALVKAKAGKGDATAYQGTLVAVAQQVAAAAKEGGFMGMGGTAVSPAEKAAIDALVTTVNAA